MCWLANLVYKVNELSSWCNDSVLPSMYYICFNNEEYM